MKTTRIKISKLTGASLDWTVAKCEQVDYSPDSGTNSIGIEYHATNYSKDWEIAGPIIESKNISVFRCEDFYGVNSKGYCNNKRIPVYGAVIKDYFDETKDRDRYRNAYDTVYSVPFEKVVHGTTPLIAAMRCYVQSKLGDNVDVPVEINQCIACNNVR